MTFLSKVLAAGFAVAVLPAAAFATCPNFGTPGAALSYTAEQVWVPKASSVVAGGDIDLVQCLDVPGEGHIVETPDFTLQYQALNMGRALEFRVEGECDTVLLVNAANGEWLFNDDADGLNPAVRIPAAGDGQYDIWVGTLGSELCAAQLIVESF